MKRNAIHYQPSDKPLGEKIDGDTVPSSSAGTEREDEITGTSWPLIKK